jgi:hypothetical protein
MDLKHIFDLKSFIFGWLRFSGTVTPPSGSDDHRAGIHVFESRERSLESEGEKRISFSKMNVILQFNFYKSVEPVRANPP